MLSTPNIAAKARLALKTFGVAARLSEWAVQDERTGAHFPTEEGEWGAIADLNKFAAPSIPMAIVVPNGTDAQFELSRYKDGNVIESRVITGEERNQLLKELSAIKSRSTP